MKKGMAMQRLEPIETPLSKLVLGCGRFGSGISRDDAFRLLDRFFECGGNALDTAHV